MNSLLDIETENENENPGSSKKEKTKGTTCKEKLDVDDFENNRSRIFSEELEAENLLVERVHHRASIC